MIKIFTNSRFPKCKACVMVKKYLHSLELEYEELDVVSNMQEYKNTIADKKGKGVIVPLVQIGSDTMVGFSKKRIDEMIINNKGLI